MKRSFEQLVAFLLLPALGCIAHHGGTPLEIATAPIAPDAVRWIVVGVRRPAVRLDPGFAGTEIFSAEDSKERVRLAMSLIRSLRATGLYREVDFEDQLSCEPHLLLEVHENPSLPECGSDMQLPGLFTFGVWPGWSTCDTGHHFSVVGASSDDLEFPWHSTEIFGWIALPLRLLPSWTWDEQRHPSADLFRSYLIATDLNAHAGVQPEELEQCSRE